MAENRWEWLHRLNTAHGLLVAIFGGSAVTAVIQGSLALLSKPTLPWWGYFLIAATLSALIALIPLLNREHPKARVPQEPDELSRLRRELQDEIGAKMARAAQAEELQRQNADLAKQLEARTNELLIERGGSSARDQIILQLQAQIEDLAKQLNDTRSGKLSWDPSGGLIPALNALDISEDAPRITPVFYTKKKIREYYDAITLANDGQQTAHDVKIETFRLGGWYISFREAHRMAHGERHDAQVEISGANNTGDLEWIIEKWMVQNTAQDEHGQLHPPAPLVLKATYRDHGPVWYQSNLELSRDLTLIDNAIVVRFINQERIDPPARATSSAAGVA